MFQAQGSTSKKPLAFLAMTITVTIWAFSAIVSKQAYEEIHPYMLLFLRFAIASIIISPFIFVKHKNPQIRTKDLPKLTFLCFLLTVLGSAGWLIGLYYTTATHAAIIGALGPIFVIFFERWLLKRIEKPAVYAGAALGLFGTILVIGEDVVLGTTTDGEAKAMLLGDMFILLSAIAPALYSVLIQKDKTRYHIFQKTAFAFILAMLFALPLALLAHRQNPFWVVNAGPKAWFGVLYYAIASSVIAYLLYLWATENTTPLESGIFFYLQPVITIIAAMILLGEKPGTLEWAGSILVFLGVIITTVFQSKAVAKKEKKWYHSENNEEENTPEIS